MTEIYSGKRLKVELNRFTLPDGREKERVVVRPGNAAVMLPIEDDHCYLIRQYRFAIGEYIYEAPAGTLDPGEEPVETAHRELIEECGLAAAEMIPHGFIYTTPGFSDEQIYLFEARGLTPSHEYEPDDDEMIEVVRVPLAEVKAMCRDGRIADAKTIAIICRCLR
ncbi:NUDIX hydrolase [Methanofollis formosanus]|uniref:NUDIX hydrolase n=1 Tax=Methanofollis formosanus TaxID=299308 RepID=A0A8G1A340_9EURY|nr:NUDIX hydrolase [Methanofollis formosanus]QYZ79197.1 NUDIX hydrolase [Methanofollis formosanus]